jgi:hypothetical protein
VTKITARRGRSNQAILFKTGEGKGVEIVLDIGSDNALSEHGPSYVLRSPLRSRSDVETAVEELKKEVERAGEEAKKLLRDEGGV